MNARPKKVRRSGGGKRIGMGKATRGVEPTSVDDLDERQAASWMKQAAAMPFFGGKKQSRRSQALTKK